MSSHESSFGVGRKADGTWRAFCALCEYMSKPFPDRGRANGALRQHECGNRHRRALWAAK